MGLLYRSYFILVFAALTISNEGTTIHNRLAHWGARLAHLGAPTWISEGKIYSQLLISNEGGASQDVE